MIQMGPVGLKYIFPCDQPANKGKEGIIDKMKQQQRDHQQGGVCIVIQRGDNGQGGKGKAQECAAHIPHEQSTFWKIEHQESQCSCTDSITYNVGKIASLAVRYDA